MRGDRKFIPITRIVQYIRHILLPSGQSDQKAVLRLLTDNL